MGQAELHVHIEGTLEPKHIFQLAERNKVKLKYPTLETLKEAYQFENLQDFLDLYFSGMSVLLTAQDFHDLAWAYLLKCKEENVRRTEIFFDPQAHTDRGVPLSAVMEGLGSACARAAAELDVSAALILCFLRHLSADAADAALTAAIPYVPPAAGAPPIIGVGLDSSERGNPPERFAAVFARARSLGLRRVAHAGEEGPPAYVRGALDALGVDRIDHGVRSLEDPELVERLVAEGMALTVCPLSNIKLCVFKDMRDHNLGLLLSRGIKATVNSDDPAYFGGYINQNFLETFEALDLDADAAYQLALNSFEASFAPPEDKARWIQELDEVFKAFSEPC
ncbi:hypothetical protein JKP88DRAFT_258920 [Tribonema minus]|uniref:Adenosine deaminase domain-containing protein n=1 Tax=Tribonema minus TaxID=303371 RepID=A0A835YKG5_9STRA|nr:hypothetical protein JKP88DRAFT_258920 [Tribonema minus]